MVTQMSKLNRIDGNDWVFHVHVFNFRSNEKCGYLYLMNLCVRLIALLYMRKLDKLQLDDYSGFK